MDRISPHRTLKFRAAQTEGVNECKALLEGLKDGKVNANFIEGMGCTGGCVGGPRRNVDIDEGKSRVNDYESQSSTDNPIDNVSIKHLLEYLKSREDEGFEQLLLREYKR